MDFDKACNYDIFKTTFFFQIIFEQFHFTNGIMKKRGKLPEMAYSDHFKSNFTMKSQSLLNLKMPVVHYAKSR